MKIDTKDERGGRFIATDKGNIALSREKTTGLWFVATQEYGEHFYLGRRALKPLERRAIIDALR